MVWPFFWKTTGSYQMPQMRQSNINNPTGRFRVVREQVEQPFITFFLKGESSNLCIQRYIWHFYYFINEKLPSITVQESLKVETRINLEKWTSIALTCHSAITPPSEQVISPMEPFPNYCTQYLCLSSGPLAGNKTTNRSNVWSNE